MSQAPHGTKPRPCLELGVCQNRRPLCDDCIERPLRFAPGVIDGPHRARHHLQAIGRNTSKVLRNVCAWLMGPSP
jgi:hypothetical protein